MPVNINPESPEQKQALKNHVDGLRSEGLTDNEIKDRLEVTEITGVVENERTGQVEAVRFTSWEPVQNRELREPVIGLPSTHPKNAPAAQEAFQANAEGSSKEIVGLPSTH